MSDLVESVDRTRSDLENPAATEKTPLLGGGCKGGRPALNRRSTMIPDKIPKKSYSAWDRFFMRDKNPKFANDVELAVRAATFILICSTQFLFPHGTMVFADIFVDGGFYSQGSVVMFVYTLYKTVGQTVNFAKAGLFGTFLANVFIWFLFGVCPGGVSETSPTWYWYFGVMAGVNFVILCLLLNFEKNTQIFALCNFVIHWFNFLEVAEGGTYSHGFKLNSKSTAISGTITAGVGCICALITILLPYPIWAFRKGEDAACDIVRLMGVIWQDSADFYCAAERHTFELDRLLREMDALQKLASSLKDHVANSWWECFGIGKWNKSRLMMYHLDKALQENCDRLHTVIICCGKEAFGPDHVKLMGSLKPIMNELLDKTGELMQITVLYSCDGVIDSGEEKDLKEKSVGLREVIKKFSAAWQQQKTSLNMGGMSSQWRCENVVGLSFCAQARIAADFADAIVAHHSGEAKLSPNPSDAASPMAVFDTSVILETYHLRYVAQNSLAILLAFFFGFNGWSKILPPSAQIAMTCSILLSKFAGSAMSNNLNRLQGVVLGTVIGQLVYCLFGWCYIWAYCVLSVILWVWLSSTLYMYYSDSKFASIGILLAAFGTQNFLTGCSHEVFNPDTTYSAIVYVVVAILTMIFCDTLVQGNEKITHVAYQSLVDYQMCMRKCIGELFDPKEETVTFHKAELLSKLGRVESWQSDAMEEPRLWRTPWNKDAFAEAIKVCHSFRIHISSMEFSMSKSHKDGGVKRITFVSQLQHPEFDPIRTMFDKKMLQMQDFTKILLHEVTGPMPELEAMGAYEEDKFGETCSHFADVATIEEKAKSNDNLEDDIVCQLCLVLISADALMASMKGFQHSILDD